MDEYIKREAALEICETEYRDRLRAFDYCGDTVAWNIGSEIKALPAADVAPVVHGRWINPPLLGIGVCSCSNCKDKSQIFVFSNGEISEKFCPLCGARMDGGSENG